MVETGGYRGVLVEGHHPAVFMVLIVVALLVFLVVYSVVEICVVVQLVLPVDLLDFG